MSKRRPPSSYVLPESDGHISGMKLQRASRDRQIDVMRTWFYSNFEHPANSTPYESAEGGYIWIWGGPYDPQEVLEAEFGGLLKQDVIEELSSELSDISSEWSGVPEYDDIGEERFNSIVEADDQIGALKLSLRNIEALSGLNVPAGERGLLDRLLFVNAITALETYLSDVFIHSVGRDSNLLRKFVQTTPEFKTEKIPIAEVFALVDAIERKSKSYIMDVVWHHLERVRPMYRDTLGIAFPKEMGELFKAVDLRHDLVHRNGKSKEGKLHAITSTEVLALVERVREFCSYIEQKRPDRPEIEF